MLSFSNIYRLAYIIISLLYILLLYYHNHDNFMNIIYIKIHNILISIVIVSIYLNLINLTFIKLIIVNHRIWLFYAKDNT